jgi:hypothetical protein
VDNDILKQIIETISTLAPATWEVLVKQVYIDMAQMLLWALLLIVLGFLLQRYVLRSVRKNEGLAAEDNLWYEVWGDPDYWVPVVCAWAMLLSAVVCFGGAMGRFINPEYYAIQNIVQMIGG